MTVIFSTYQSLDVIADAQKAGLPKIDLIVCDEAHRTTGVSLVGNSESNFQRVHNDGFHISRETALYDRYPPYIRRRGKKEGQRKPPYHCFNGTTRPSTGRNFTGSGSGQASEMGILAPYKVVIFNVDMEQVGIDLEEHLSDESSPINLSNAASMVGCWNGLGKRGASGFDFGTDPFPANGQWPSATDQRIQTLRRTLPQDCGELHRRSRRACRNPLRCQVHHVDGTQNALVRANHLSWLRRSQTPGPAVSSPTPGVSPKV